MTGSTLALLFALTAPSFEPVASAVTFEPDPRPAVTLRPANPDGHVPIVMYHRFGPSEKYMVRSYANFRNDLRRLYDLGFRPVTLLEYAEGSFDLPPGASPVVLTFDDSTDSQFRIRKDGSIDPDSGVGIWKAFADEHPDFPVRGTWFVLPNGPWEQKGLGERKARLLMDWGSEIASHTISHRPLNTLPDAEVKREMAESMRFVKRLTGKAARTLALPYGNIPKNRALLHGFQDGGDLIVYSAVVLAGSAPAPSPENPDRNLKLLPRVLAYPGTLGIDYWLDRVEQGKSHPYVTE